MLMNIKNLIIVVILLAAGVLGFWASQKHFGENSDKVNKEKTVDYQSLLVYPSQKGFSGFKLIDKNKKDLIVDDFANHWTLMFFGYTSCPDVCPNTLSELQKTFKILQNNKLKQMPKVLFVSVDAQRDKPEVLNDYINFFNPEFNAATGDEANMLALTSQIGAAFHIAKHEPNAKNYEVDHTAAIFLVNPEKNLYGLFRSPHQAKTMAADLTALIGQK